MGTAPLGPDLPLIDYSMDELLPSQLATTVYICHRASKAQEVRAVKNTLLARSSAHGIAVQEMGVDYIDFDSHLNRLVLVQPYRLLEKLVGPVFCPTDHMVLLVRMAVAAEALTMGQLDELSIKYNSQLELVGNREFLTMEVTSPQGIRYAQASVDLETLLEQLGLEEV